MLIQSVAEPMTNEGPWVYPESSEAWADKYRKALGGNYGSYCLPLR